MKLFAQISFQFKRTISQMNVNEKQISKGANQKEEHQNHCGNDYVKFIVKQIANEIIIIVLVHILNPVEKHNILNISL